MATVHPSLTDPRIGQTVYGRHPLTGELYIGERYTVVAVCRSAIDGLLVIIRNTYTGEVMVSSASFLCR